MAKFKTKEFIPVFVEILEGMEAQGIKTIAEAKQLAYNKLNKALLKEQKASDNKSDVIKA